MAHPILWRAPDDLAAALRHHCEGASITQQSAIHDAITQYLETQSRRCPAVKGSLRCGLQAGHTGPHWCSGFSWEENFEKTP